MTVPNQDLQESLRQDKSGAGEIRFGMGWIPRDYCCVALCFVVLSVLTGCTAVRVSEMVPESFTVRTTHPYSVSVGHEEASARSELSLDPGAAIYWGRMDATHANADAFMSAVVAGVTQSKLFQSVSTASIPSDPQLRGGYRLDVNIVSEVQPRPGLQMRSTLVTAWKLTRARDGQVVFNELIEETGTATPGSVVGVRTAIEATVRQTIREGIERIGGLELTEVDPVSK